MISAAPKFFVFPFVLWGAVVAAQIADSLPEASQEVTYATDLATAAFEPAEGNPVDTTLAYVHYFDPADQSNFLIRNNGNLGSAHFQLVCCPEPETGFHLGYDQYALYRFTKNNIRFYKNAHPYSRLNMNIGQRKEQIFEVEHSQNIRKKFNFGFHYKRFASNGSYQRQQTRNNALAFTTAFDTKKRYLLKTELIFNSIKTEENGGIKDTRIFYDTSFVTKELVDVELTEAENKRRDIYFHAYQSWSFREKQVAAITDTVAEGKPPADTAATTDTIPVVHSEPPQKRKWELFHEIDIGRERFEFNDLQPDSAYYGLFYYQEDSVPLDYLSKAQRLFFGSGLGIRKHFAQKLALEISANYTFNFIEQDENPEAQFQDLELHVSFLRDTSARLFYGASANYSFLDYTKDDFRVKAFIGSDCGRYGRIQADAAYMRFQPAWLFKKFSFEEISWNNDFDKQADLTLGITYQLSKYHFRISAQFHNIDGLAFWNEDRLPSQSGSLQQVWVFELRKLFRINYFGFDNLIRVQLVSDKELLRFPVYWGVHSIYYERGVFKGKLLTKVGLDVRYNTNYRAYGYFPMTGQFHLQQAETLKFYPVMDVYVSFRIKTVRLFLIFNHVNQGLFRDRGYFHAYKYPADERHFRFGVSWMFLD